MTEVVGNKKVLWQTLIISCLLLAALAEVIEQQSFELAAQKLFISQSAISQRIKALEEHIGQPVLIRNQPIVATLAGEQILSHFKKVKQLEYELVPIL